MFTQRGVFLHIFIIKIRQVSHLGSMMKIIVLFIFYFFIGVAQAGYCDRSWRRFLTKRSQCKDCAPNALKEHRRRQYARLVRYRCECDQQYESQPICDSYIKQYYLKPKEVQRPSFWNVRQRELKSKTRIQFGIRRN